MSEIETMFAIVKAALADTKPVAVGLWMNPATLDAFGLASAGDGRHGVPVRAEPYIPPSLAMVEYSNGSFELIELSSSATPAGSGEGGAR